MKSTLGGAAEDVSLPCVGDVPQLSKVQANVIANDEKLTRFICFSPVS
jgi:hypothetical protein